MWREHICLVLILIIYLIDISGQTDPAMTRCSTSLLIIWVNWVSLLPFANYLWIQIESFLFPFFLLEGYRSINKVIKEDKECHYDISAAGSRGPCFSESSWTENNSINFPREVSQIVDGLRVFLLLIKGNGGQEGEENIKWNVFTAGI